jgi:hypothetical protein
MTYVNTIVGSRRFGTSFNPCRAKIGVQWSVCRIMAIYIHIIPHSRGLLEKLVKQFPAFYRTRMFTPRSLQPATCPFPEPDQFSPRPPPSSFWKLNYNIVSNLRLGIPSRLFSSRSPTKTLYAPLLSHIRDTCPAYTILLDLIIRIIFGGGCRL